MAKRVDNQEFEYDLDDEYTEFRKTPKKLKKESEKVFEKKKAWDRESFYDRYSDHRDDRR
jgi:hypothetical protein